LDSSIAERFKGESSQEKGLPGEPIEKEIVKKMKVFPEWSLFKYR